MPAPDATPLSPRVTRRKLNYKKLWRYTLPVVCLWLGVWLVGWPPARIDHLDAVADRYFDDSVMKASVAYGTSRLINAGVSVVKDSSVQLQPAGLGISLAVGQVLDPLDDLNERLSSLLVTAIISLLAQKICYEIAQEFVFGIIGATLILVSVLSYIPGSVFVSYRNLLLKVALFLLVVRLFLPVSALLSNQLNERLFFPQIGTHQRAMEPMVKDLEKLTNFETPKIRGIGDVFTEPVRLMQEKSDELKLALTMLVINGLELFHHMISIMSLYIGIFVVQVMFLPVAMFWLLNKLLFVLFAHTIPQPWLVSPIPPTRLEPDAERV
jgi:hypothetical protein